MKTNTQKIFLKSFYLLGCFIDGVVGIFMLISLFINPQIIIPYSSISNEFRFAMGWGAALMFGWTILLLWGSYAPVERKAILLMTAFPVVSGLILTNIFVDPIKTLTIWITQILIIIFICVFGYSLALKIQRLQSSNKLPI